MRRHIPRHALGNGRGSSTGTRDNSRTTLGLWMAPRCVHSARMTPRAASRVDVSAAPGLAMSTPSTTCARTREPSAYASPSCHGFGFSPEVTAEQHRTANRHHSAAWT